MGELLAMKWVQDERDSYNFDIVDQYYQVTMVLYLLKNYFPTVGPTLIYIYDQEMRW